MAKTIFSGRQWLLYVIIAVIGLAVPALILQFAQVILDFCLGGIVPGTDIVVPPEVIMWSVIVMLSFGAGSFAWRSARSRRRRRMHIPVMIHESHAESASVAPATPIHYVHEGARVKVRPNLSVSLWHIPRRAAKRFIVGVGVVFMSGMQNIGRAGQRIGIFIGITLVSSMRFLGRFSRGVGHIIAITTLFIARVLSRGSRMLYRATIKAAKVSWRWSKPHLRSFDAWIEIRFRKLERWSAARFSEFMRTMRRYL